MDPIVRRILAELGAPELVERMARLPASDLTSLQMAVARARAEKVTAAGLLQQSERGGMVAPSPVDARVFAALDAAAFDAAKGFEAVALAPVAPFGVDAVFGGISPNNVLVAARPVQAMADPTTSLALLAAARRRKDRSAIVRLIASHRVIRLQPIAPENKDFTPHFHLLGAVTAGRDAGSHAFELAALREHLGYILQMFANQGALGYAFDPVEIRVADTAVMRGLLAAAGVDANELARVHGYDADGGAGVLAKAGLVLPTALDPEKDLAHLDGTEARAGRRRLIGVAREVVPALAAAFPSARVTIDGSRLAGLGYYDGLMLQVWATDRTGASLPIGDGGFTTWTQTLLGDRKERLLTSGVGLELAAKRYFVR